MGKVSLSLSCHIKLTDRRHDILGPCDLMWPWPKVRYWPDHPKWSCTHFEAPWRDEHDGGRIKPLAFLVQKLLPNLLAKNSYFDVFIPSAKINGISLYLTACLPKNSLRAIKCFLRDLLSDLYTTHAKSINSAVAKCENELTQSPWIGTTWIYQLSLSLSLFLMD